MDTKQKVRLFLAEFEMPKETLCKRLDISRQTLRLWLNGELNLSKTTIERIDNYLSKYDAILTDGE